MTKKYHGKWIQGKEIGSGGNANVYLTIDDNNKEYAIKVLSSKELTKMDRFKREANICKKYPSLVGNTLIPIVEIDASLPPRYYVMPLGEGVKKYRFGNLADKCDAIILLLQKLKKLHSNNITHRDIKPENILFYDQNFYFIDFGLVFIEKLPRITIETKKERIGARRTIAPEMERSDSYNSDFYKADIYSMAKTIWMIITDDYECFEGEYIPNSKISFDNKNIGYFDNTLGRKDFLFFTPLEDLMIDCTTHDPQKRPNAGELLDRFLEWVDIHYDFHRRNNAEWSVLANVLFPFKMPSKAEWTNIDDIVEVLNCICKQKSLSYMFLPRGGTHCFEVIKATEDGFIEINKSSIPYLFPVKSLTFYSFGDNAEWNYFRLDSTPKEKIFSNNNDFNEDLTELSPNTYAPYEVYENEEEFNGFFPTNNMRQVVRYYGGSIVFFNTRSPYNIESSTAGRHMDLSEDEFEFYIKGCSQGVFGLKYSEFEIHEIKRLFYEKYK